MGLYAPGRKDIARGVYFGLHSLQHRGQESCGIAVSDTKGPKGKVLSSKGMGLVNEVFDSEKLEKLNENLNNSIFGLSGFNSTSVTMEAATHYAQDNAKYKIMFHVVRSRSGAFIGQHSWINTDKEVLFDRKCKFRALQPWEPGYIKEDVVKDGFRHIAIVEV